ncbi:hypothetical protein NFC73_17575 [Pseudarthrobacter sp. RMG13]|uniref:Secreted protein n=1 Tax=Pseudarthrobacter humi TaxID=2952523 RepID=A0ABT1LSX6_9MICC|nr:hypothetical protein [Pseudarthrobacter humi]MCP9001522.1 hypothetical protein [Pseudarthrobacter humi]
MVVRSVFVAGFLEVVLQFLLRLPAALTYGPHLLRRRSGVGVLVWAVILQAVRDLLAHTEIIPPCVSVGKAPRHVETNDGGRSRRRPTVAGAQPISGLRDSDHRGGNPAAG